MPYLMSKILFDQIVRQALQELPPPFAQALAEVAIEVRQEPTRAQLRRAGVGRNTLLLGLYEGVPLTQRSVEMSAKLPDRIRIFRSPIEQVSGSREEVAEKIRSTVLHEIGHYFGMDEKQLDELGYG